MANIVLNGKYRVTTFTRHVAGQNQLNSHVFEVVGLVGVNILEQDAFDGLAIKLRDAYKLIIPASSTFQGMKWAIEAIIPVAEGVSVVTGGAGVGVNDPLPPQTSPLVSWRSSGAPAGVRGRTYLPSTTEPDSSTQGELSAGLIASIDTWANTVKAFLAVPAGVGKTVDWTRRIRRNVAGTITYFPITTHITRSRFATQRRRSGINRADAPLV